MLIFGNDDNDDDLDFDGKKSNTPSTSSPSSLPTKPETKSPFGSNADQMEHLVPEQGTGVPPRTPPSPFGQAPLNNKGNKSRLPINPRDPRPQTDAITKESNGVRKPLPPFSRPVAPETTREPVTPTPPTVPHISSYLPPKAQTPAPVELAPEPQGLSEAELYLKAVREQAAEAAAQAQRQEVERQSLLAHTAPPVEAMPAVAPTPTPVPVPAPIQHQENTNGKKKKKAGFFSPPPKNQNSVTRKASVARPERESKYEGERRKVLYIRLVAGTVATIIAIAGFQAIFIPDSGPSKAMVQSAAKEAVNYTGFPTASGEQFALDFSKAYFNYDSSKGAERLTSLERFASKELAKQIDIQILSSGEYEAVKKSNVSYSNYVVTESITYGPYVVAAKNLTDKNALFTVKVGLKSGSVVYLDVPVKYNPEEYSMTLAGPPSFTKPIQNQGSTEVSEYTMVFEGGEDEQVERDFQNDLNEYLKAWAASNETIMERYVLDSASDNARKGLQGSVIFNKVLDLKIQSEDKDDSSTANARRVEIKVLWEDPSTGLRYPQQYRMLIGKNPEGKWAVHDIENFAVLNK